jgi:hypothetical protein
VVGKRGGHHDGFAEGFGASMESSTLQRIE